MGQMRRKRKQEKGDLRLTTIAGAHYAGFNSLIGLCFVFFLVRRSQTGMRNPLHVKFI